MEVHVQVIERSFVAPSAPTPNKGLWLSSLDLEATRSHTPAIYLYRRRPRSCCDGDDFFDVARIKESMAKALVMFYPLAGRIGVDANGRMEINCGDREGALFVVARAPHLTADKIRSMKPSPQLRELLVPRIEPPSAVMVIQVTWLNCGGVALGAAIHHAATDAPSAFHFFQTWSAISRNGEHAAAVELPCNDRTLLHARSPPTVHAGALSKLFYPKSTLLDPSGHIIGPVLAISPGQVASLKQLCGGGASTFCAVSALVWQCRCAALARRLLPGSDSEETRLCFPINIRRKMVPPLPARYFGNALVKVCATGASARDIASEALAAVAGRLRDAIAGVDDELVRSAIDYYEMDGGI